MYQIRYSVSSRMSQSTVDKGFTIVQTVSRIIAINFNLRMCSFYINITSTNDNVSFGQNDKKYLKT